MLLFRAVCLRNVFWLLQPMQINIKDLVASSPHHTDDGAVVLSSVTNTAFLLNKDTGALIRQFDNSGKVLEKAASFANGQAKAEDAELLLQQNSFTDSEKKVNTMLCLRTDYSVTVQELATGKIRWNVSLGEVKTLSLVQASGQSSMLRHVDANENSNFVKPVLGASVASSRPSYQVAPIAIFSSSGELSYWTFLSLCNTRVVYIFANLSMPLLQGSIRLRFCHR